MKRKHYLTAYYSETAKFLAFLFSVPSAFMRRVSDIAHVAPTDVDAVGSYPLSVDEAHAIAKLLDKQIKIDKKPVFFLEPVSSE